MSIKGRIIISTEYIEMSYIVAIPSYKRAVQLQNRTLTTLFNAGIPKEKINVFIIEEEKQEYLETLNKDYYNELIVGVLGITNQREFIENYYPAGTKIVSFDDDVDKVDLSLTEYKSLDEFITDAFITCEKENAFIWSVYPVWNEYFRKDRPVLTTGLTYIIGAFFGFINRHDEDLKLVLTREGNKEDVERSILYWLKDKKVLRFNKIGFKTKYYGVGGLGGLKERIEKMKTYALAIQAKYPLITRIKIRKNGLYEIVFREPKGDAITIPPSVHSVPTEQKPVAIKMPKVKKEKVCVAQNLLKEDGTEVNTPEPPKIIAEIEPSRDDLLNIYNLLESIKVPCVDGGRGRSGTFGRHRAMTLGMIRARRTKEYGLSYNSKKYPELYNAIVEFGKTFIPFEFNAIHVNHNVVCPRHKDPYNTGNSCLISLGDYEGCNLMIEGFGEYNTNCRALVFDGTKSYHYNTPLISGNKYSLVFFTNSH